MSSAAASIMPTLRSPKALSKDESTSSTPNRRAQDQALALQPVDTDPVEDWLFLVQPCYRAIDELGIHGAESTGRS